MADNDKTRHRSRAHPLIDLREAVERARVLYEKDGFSWISAEVVTEHFGFKRGSSSGFRYVSALLQFGLLEDEGSGAARKVRLTPLARRILQHPDDAERENALQGAALNPTIHKELWERYEGNFPSDRSLRYDLTANRDFNENAVDSFIENLRSTLAFAGISESVILEQEDPDLSEGGGGKDDLPPPGKKEMPQVQYESQSYDLSILLPTGEMAVLRMPSRQTKKTFEHLQKAIRMNLELLADSVVRDDPAPDDEGADD